MKKIFSLIGGFALILVSFYLTDKVSFMIINKSYLMKEIETASSLYNEKPCNAIINKENNSIIPGKYGKKINEYNSYNKMKDFKVFNQNFLVYDYIKPDESLEDNKDKYIISGNKSNRNVSIILEYNEELMGFLNSEKIKYDVILEKETDYKKEISYINGAYNQDDFYKINKLIKTPLCIKKYSNISLCLKENYYIISPEIVIYKDYLSFKKINNGSLILIKNNTSLENINLLIKDLRYKNLEPVYVSTLIKEK